MIALADRLRAPADLPRATHNFNRAQIHGLAELVSQHLGAGEAAGILGLTYKPNTDVTEEAAGLLLARELAARGLRVMAYDPEGRIATSHKLGGSIHMAISAEECIAQSSVVVLATLWPAFLAIPAERWAGNGSSNVTPRVVIDCWRALKHLEAARGVLYLALGNGIAPQESRAEGAAQ